MAADWEGMRRHAVILSLIFVVLATLSVVGGWALFPGGGGWRALAAVWTYVLAAAVITAAFAALFMWLAVYSANYGYDDPADTKGR